MTSTKAPQTIAAATGIGSDTSFGAVAPPLYLSSTYTFAEFQSPRKYEYSRTANPTRDQLADTLANLEGGTGAIVTASGMAAVDLVLSLVSPDQLVLAPHDCYSGTYRLLSMRAAKGHLKVAFIDQSNPSDLAEGLAGRPALVLVETPSNPLMRIIDIASIATQAKAVGAKLAVDNTFLSPALQRPLLLGADIVIHSTTKYLNGHSDVVGGAVIAQNPADLDHLKTWANVTGVTGAPFDAYLTLRGLRTLFPRIEQQQRSAAAIADFLQSHPQVSAVHYPGLTSHPGHEIAARQQAGYGAMLSLDLAGGLGSVRSFLGALKVFTLAESLGGIESLVAHPATMTHVGMGEAARRAAGIGDGLVRVSVGLEAEKDLIADLEQALNSIPR